MSESGDYEPSNWGSSHSFGSARRSYSSRSASVSSSRSSSSGASSLLEATVTTKCENPLVICCDVTGSMGHWPDIMFGKLPYMENEAKEYLGKDVEMCWSAVRDFRDGDSHTLQVRPFTKGKKLVKAMNEILEGGGGRETEAYDLAAAYFANNCDMPNAINPVMIFIADDKLYPKLSKADAKTYAKVDLPNQQTIGQLFSDLKQKFDVYLLQKVTDVRGNDLYGYDAQVYKSWRKVLDEDHIMMLPDPARVADCIYAILAAATGKVEYFEEELKDRQLKDVGGEEKVKTVMHAARTIHVTQIADPKKKKKRSKKLL